MLNINYAQLAELNIQKSLNTVAVSCRKSSTDKLIYKILDTFNSHLTFYVTVNWKIAYIHSLTDKQSSCNG